MKTETQKGLKNLTQNISRYHDYDHEIRINIDEAVKMHHQIMLNGTDNGTMKWYVKFNPDEFGSEAEIVKLPETVYEPGEELIPCQRIWRTLPDFDEEKQFRAWKEMYGNGEEEYEYRHEIPEWTKWKNEAIRVKRHEFIRTRRIEITEDGREICTKYV